MLDDAAHTITAEALRGIQRLRSANAGAPLTLRCLEDVPEALRGGLLGVVVGCRIAFSGLATWDGAPFAEAWARSGGESGCHRPADRRWGAGQKACHLAREFITGEPVTAKAVTVRRVERERRSASDIAGVQAGHAVLSVTAVTEESALPLLVDLR
ncbi:hypothetical protein ACIGW8_18380 [Streptomyces sioyaensis]|uniref:hypothetical protein n=1 Tax=Streptomyces sioyaensis TaxID=67364 RepID=UPI0037D42DF6